MITHNYILITLNAKIKILFISDHITNYITLLLKILNHFDTVCCCTNIVKKIIVKKLLKII